MNQAFGLKAVAQIKALQTAGALRQRRVWKATLARLGYERKYPKRTILDLFSFVDRAQAGLSRDELVKVLHAENVLARKYFWPGCHRMEPYRSLYPYAGLLLPETERLAARVIVLPTGQVVTPEVIQTICAILRSAHAQSASVRAALSEGP